ncbi:unnamed protein product [Allacma fusca]|uniref:limulus clotting factor C n=1 Tax=Allacma fusca TaxID=39272 RepID=A0A8J2L9B0_9HEXA|nr:unnamed protein product [Allacma fusca]
MKSPINPKNIVWFLPTFVKTLLVLDLLLAKCEPAVAADEKIVGGQEAPKNGYPSVVPLNIWGYHECAATIIHQEWLLSAAHCLSYNAEVESFSFMAGEHNLQLKEDTEQNVTAIQMLRHTKFNLSTYENDIVLFKITPPLKFNKYVQKALLPDPDFNPVGISTPVGWGKTDNSSRSQVLMEVDIPIITNEKCKEVYKDKIFDTKICAMEEDGGKDSCNRDSGGPLYFKKDGKQILVGITSHGNGCGLKGWPGVYTRVSKFLQWMKETSGVDFTADGPAPPGSKPGKSGIRKIFMNLAESVCNQHQKYKQTQKIPKPVRKKPGSSIKAGYLAWKTCPSSACNPFKFLQS